MVAQSFEEIQGQFLYLFSVVGFIFVLFFCFFPLRSNRPPRSRLTGKANENTENIISEM